MSSTLFCSKEDPKSKKPWHRHCHLIGGVAKYAAVYPPALMKAVLRTLKDRLQREGELGALDMDMPGPIPEEPDIMEQWREILGVDGGF